MYSVFLTTMRALYVLLKDTTSCYVRNVQTGCIQLQLVGNVKILLLELIVIVINNISKYLTPGLHTKFIMQNWGMQGYTYFLILALKHRLWVLVRTASAKRF